MDKLLMAAKQARAVQEQFTKKMAAVTVEGIAGGKMVTVRLNGKRECVAVAIDPSLLAANKKTVLEDLVKTAVTDACKKIGDEEQKEQAAMVKSAMEEMGAGGGLGGLGSALNGLGGLFKGLK